VRRTRMSGHYTPMPPQETIRRKRDGLGLLPRERDVGGRDARVDRLRNGYDA
jgi:hypothetical protein